MPNESTSDAMKRDLPPASSGNRARQARSRLNTTHPVQWIDENMERQYNRVRDPKREKKRRLKRLHQNP